MSCCVEGEEPLGFIKGDFLQEINNYTGQHISIFFSVMNMLLIYLFASMKLEKGHKKLLASSFKITLALRYFTK